MRFGAAPIQQHQRAIGCQNRVARREIAMAQPEAKYFQAQVSEAGMDCIALVC